MSSNATDGRLARRTRWLAGVAVIAAGTMAAQSALGGAARSALGGEERLRYPSDSVVIRPESTFGTVGGLRGEEYRYRRRGRRWSRWRPRDRAQLHGSSARHSLGGDINNSSSRNVRATVTAICAGSGRYEQAATGATIDGDSFAVAQANCPAETQVVGGGVNALDSGNVEVTGSFPIDRGDGDERPDDGWRAKVTNENAEPVSMETVAICARRGRLTYPTEARTLPEDTERTARARCRSSAQVIGGGLNVPGSDPGYEGSESYPFDSRRCSRQAGRWLDRECAERRRGWRRHPDQGLCHLQGVR